MADNTQVLNPSAISGGAGDVIATDDIGGVKYQRVKIIAGADGVNDGDISSSNPLPVSTSAVSEVNSSSATLASGATFTGTGEDVSHYPSVVVAVKTDQDGTLYMEFSPDNTNWDSSLSFPTTAGVNEVHRLSVTRRYYRCRFTNTSVSAQTYFRLQSTFGAQPPLTSALNSTVQNDADSLVTRSVLMGENGAGQVTFVPVTAEGHIEVAIHDPRLPFGSVHTENLKPIFQSDGVYGVNAATMLTTTGLAVGTGSGSGSVAATGNKLVCSTGVTQYSFASLQSRRRLRYRAGQGVVGRFAGLFSTPAASAFQVAGFGTAETTLAYGYNGTSFGILYSTGGVREIHTFTVTTASTSTQPYNVTLPNTAVVNVTATNNSSTTQTAYEISQGTFPGWNAEAIGATVVFTAASAGNKSGSFSLAQSGAGSPAAGTDAETLAGVASTDTWIPQASWNGDVMDGSGSASNPSGVLLDPSKGNVYQIGVQYLGFGTISFAIEIVPTNGNNPTFETVHVIRFPNSSTSVSLSQPSFPFLAAASSAGSTTDVSVSVSSFAGFNEGDIVNLGPRMSYSRDSVATSSTSAFVPLLTVRNGRYFAGRVNQTVSNLLDVSGAASGNANATTKFYLVRNATLTGPVNFTQFAATSSTYMDVAATGMSTPGNSQIIWTRSIGQTNDFEYSFSDREITMQPGESVTLCVKSLTATASCTGGFNTREDQ